MMDRREALALARQFRTCPSAAAAADANAAQMQEHRKHCPYCGDFEGTGPDSWQALADDLVAAVRAPAPPPAGAGDAFIPGQLRYVSGRGGLWQWGDYYAPPLVMVVQDRRPHGEGLLVAQTYHDLLMAGPGDLVIEDEQTGAGELFVESWNVYTLQPTDLGPVIAALDPQIGRAVERLAEAPDALPDWAPRLRPMAAHDPRLYFREMEVTVAHAFASLAVAELVAARESVLDPAYETLDAMRKALRSLRDGIEWILDPSNYEEVLALARLPEAEYAMAAADADEERVAGVAARIRDGRVATIHPATARIDHRAPTDAGLTIIGCLEPLPFAADETTVLVARLVTADQTVLAPDKLSFAPESGDFVASFSSQAGEAPRFAFAVCHADTADEASHDPC